MAIELRPEVQAFAEQIESRLRKHDHDRGDSWRTMNFAALLGYLARRVGKLQTAMVANSVGQMEKGEVTKQAASVGAAAMFIADVLGGLLDAPAPGRTEEMGDATTR